MGHKTLRLAGLLAAISLIAVLLAPTVLASKHHHTFHFVDHSVGASISATESVAVTHDPGNGQGASVETLKFKNGLVTGRVITYWTGGTTTDVVSSTLGSANAQGLLPVSGKGHQVAATGEFKGSSSKFTFTGTYDPKTTITHVTLRGTVTT